MTDLFENSHRGAFSHRMVKATKILVSLAGNQMLQKNYVIILFHETTDYQHIVNGHIIP